MYETGPHVNPQQVRTARWVLFRRTHKAAAGTVCSCGRCTAVAAQIAARFGVPLSVLLPPQEKKPDRPVSGRRLCGQIGSVATVTTNGHQLPAVQGLLQLARLAGDPHASSRAHAVVDDSQPQ